MRNRRSDRHRLICDHMCRQAASGYRIYRAKLNFCTGLQRRRQRQRKGSILVQCNTSHFDLVFLLVERRLTVQCLDVLIWYIYCFVVYKDHWISITVVYLTCYQFAVRLNFVKCRLIWTGSFYGHDRTCTCHSLTVNNIYKDAFAGSLWRHLVRERTTLGCNCRIRCAPLNLKIYSGIGFCLTGNLCLTVCITIYYRCRQHTLIDVEYFEYDNTVITFLISCANGKGSIAVTRPYVTVDL